METLQLRNIRSLMDSGPIRIAPITLLVGQNSSGKSTFARFLPMLRQGAEARTSEPFLWHGRLVDLGSANEALSRFTNNHQLGISIQQKISNSLLNSSRASLLDFIRSSNGTVTETETETELVKLSIDYCFEALGPPTYKYNFEYRQQKIFLEIDIEGNVIQFLINEAEYPNSSFKSMLIATWSGPFPTIELKEDATLNGKLINIDLIKFIVKHSDSRTGIERAIDLAKYLVSGSIYKISERALASSSGDAYWKRQVRKWGQNSSEKIQLTNLIAAQQFLGNIGLSIISVIKRELLNIKYITPLRASAERYYRLQGLSVEEIDPQGQNIAMYLHNLSPTERENFSLWMTRFFGVGVETRSSQGHVSLFLGSDIQNGYNLADTGFGYSQMLPILVQLWIAGARNKNVLRRSNVPIIFAIEQPELHLHPKLQAKLVEVFLAAIEAAKVIGVDLRLVIETHSEQIVSTLGLRIARGSVQSDDVNVVLFEKESMRQPTNVHESKFGADGVLSEWPYGFFEADA